MTPQEERDAKLKLLDAEGKLRAGEAQWQTEMNYIAKAGGFSLEQIDHLLKTPDSAVDTIRHISREATLHAMQNGDKGAEQSYSERREAERKAWREMKGRG